MRTARRVHKRESGPGAKELSPISILATYSTYKTALISSYWTVQKGGKIRGEVYECRRSENVLASATCKHS